MSKWFLYHFLSSNEGLMHIIFQYIGKADVYSDKLSEQVTNQVVL